MAEKMKFREVVKYRAGALCLVGILSATYLHTTTFMSQFFYGSLILGAIAALAIDAGVVSMSIFKDELLKDGELAWMVRVVTALVLVASGIANMSEGFKSAYGIALTYESMSKMDWLTWAQWLAGTVVFPVLAYVMSDTIGTRNLIEYKKHQEKSAGKEKIKPEVTVPPKVKVSTADAFDAGRRIPSSNREERIARLEDYLKVYPDATISEMAAFIGVNSRETVRKYLQEIER